MSYLDQVILSSATSMEPTTVFTDAELGEILETYNCRVGRSRRVSMETLTDVATRATDAYAGESSGIELANAVLWELHCFLEYATGGETDELDILGEYSDLLAAGHPFFGITAAVEARVDWLAGAPELTEAHADALKVVLSANPDPVEYIHASSRITALLASGQLSRTTVDLINSATAN